MQAVGPQAALGHQHCAVMLLQSVSLWCGVELEALLCGLIELLFVIGDGCEHLVVDLQSQTCRCGHL